MLCLREIYPWSFNQKGSTFQTFPFLFLARNSTSLSTEALENALFFPMRILRPFLPTGGRRVLIKVYFSEGKFKWRLANLLNSWKHIPGPTVDMLIAFPIMGHQVLLFKTAQGLPTSTKERANGIWKQGESRVAGTVRRLWFFFRPVVGS